MYTLLIVEDEEILREGLQITIDWAMYGFSLIGTASNGKQALELNHELRPNVILTDIKMPFIDGIELLQKVKESFPQTQVVLISSFEEFEYAKKGIEYHAFAYILKDSLHDEISKCFPKLKGYLDALLQDNIYSLKSFHQFNDESASWLKNCTDFCCAVFWKSSGTELAQPIHRDPQNTTAFLKDQYEIYVFGAKNGNDLKKILARAFSSFYATKDNRLVLGVGSPKTGRASISESYFEAMKALDFGRLNQTKKMVYDYRSICLDDLNHKPEPFNEASVETSVMLCQKADLIKYFNFSVFEVMKNPDLLISDVHLICHRLLDYFYYYLKLLGASTEYVTRQINNLYSIDSFIDCNNWIVEEISTLCDLLKKQRVSHGYNKIRQVVNLVDERFAQELKLENMACFCYISVSGFTVKFKEITGFTFSEYLKNKRMEHACYLLKNCNLKIYQVARECGYEDEKYFCRIFKSSMKLSPGAYRQSYSNGEFFDNNNG
jgi:two-component system response regulator YesN